MKRISLFVLFAVLIFIVPGCFAGGLANGNLIGTVVREGTAELIVNPSLIIGRQFKSPLVPDQQIKGNAKGKFEATMPGGNYVIQISSKSTGPFYTWPELVYVEENKTTIALFQLPAGY